MVNLEPTSAHFTTYSMGCVSNSTVMKSAPRASDSDTASSVSESSILNQGRAEEEELLQA